VPGKVAAQLSKISGDGLLFGLAITVFVLILVIIFLNRNEISLTGQTLFGAESQNIM